MSGVRRGADMLVDALGQAGIQTLFSLSGNHIMPVYDALFGHNIRLIHVRHEAAAVHMADAWARLTGKIGVALVTGGPGHANAISALYTALMSESPVVLLSGHAPLSRKGQGAFQEMDQVAMAMPVVKAAWVCASADALADDFAKACRMALSGRPGPVHLSLPSDVLEAVATNVALPGAVSAQADVQCLPETVAHEILAQLSKAKRPLIILGPQGLTDIGRVAAARLQSATGVPVVATESPRGANDPSLGAWASALRKADCVLLVGKRLDFTLGFGQAPVFAADCTFLQLDPDEIEFERTATAVGRRLSIRHQADVYESLATLSDHAISHGLSTWEAWRTEVASDLSYRPADWKNLSARGDGPVHPAQLCAAVQDLLNTHRDAVLVVDGGEFGQWAQACLTAPHRIINGAAGAIGAALPMAVAAKLIYPQAPVVAIMGDGTFGFHCAELDTALRAQAPILCVVGNDACWNAEYQIQLREYGKDRAIGCELLPTRYDRVATALGGHGEWVNSLGALPKALADAHASRLPACVNVVLAGLPAPVICRA